MGCWVENEAEGDGGDGVDDGVGDGGVEGERGRFWERLRADRVRRRLFRRLLRRPPVCVGEYDVEWFGTIYVLVTIANTSRWSVGMRVRSSSNVFAGARVSHEGLDRTDTGSTSSVMEEEDDEDEDDVFVCTCQRY